MADSILSLAERGALALADAAADLDEADDSDKFLRALERNHRIWRTLMDVALRENWLVPSRRQADFVLGTMGRAVNDDEVNALIDINRQVSAALAGGDIEHIRHRAYYIWEESGRPPGHDLDHWLLAELQVKGRH